MQNNNVLLSPSFENPAKMIQLIFYRTTEDQVQNCEETSGFIRVVYVLIFPVFCTILWDYFETQLHIC